jgi:hypothetical protein
MPRHARAECSFHGRAQHTAEHHFTIAYGLFSKAQLHCLDESREFVRSLQSSRPRRRHRLTRMAPCVQESTHLLHSCSRYWRGNFHSEWTRPTSRPVRTYHKKLHRTQQSASSINKCGNWTSLTMLPVSPLQCLPRMIGNRWRGAIVQLKPLVLQGQTTRLLSRCRTLMALGGTWWHELMLERAAYFPLICIRHQLVSEGTKFTKGSGDAVPALH